MSNPIILPPLPEPHHQSAANFNAPDEPFYTADQMHAHAAAVSAAKDAEIAGLRAELLKSLADNAPLREQVRGMNAHEASLADVQAYLMTRVKVLEGARPEPDCRTCRNFYVPHETCIEDAPCTNGDHYEPLPPVRLWRTA